MTTKISNLSRMALLLSALFLIVSLFVPIWQIDLDAPQYPEGLGLKIWANKIAGDVDIINGLNHYIGMKELHTDDFMEFTVLPYIIGAFVLFFLLSALMGKRKWLHTSLIAFVIFGIVAMVDFWKWEYDYGHNLSPNAAIIVPGMAYQPPLIGFKQLLNFGAYSVPDIGGWLFVAAGLLLVFATAKENGWLKKLSRKKTNASLVGISFLAVVLSSCGTETVQPIKLNTDNCDFCRMTISDGKFAAEVITQKGRAYKFDDLSCMLGYVAEQAKGSIKSYYINDYLKDNELIDATSAWYVYDEEFRSPMGGNTAAFSSQETARAYAEKLGVQETGWNEVSEQQPEHEHHEEH
ncbi:MAG: nitrous oxide reductase accessory protein NosL [Bacteroidetes bacterium]|nr:nitrous oxide reductase accessory protein NosL [Bacteroidota bacterium]